MKKESVLYLLNTINRCVSLAFMIIMIIHLIIKSKLIHSAIGLWESLYPINWTYLVSAAIIILILLSIYFILNKKYRRFFWDRIFPILFFLGLVLKAIYQIAERLDKRKSLFIYIDIVNCSLALSFVLIILITYIIRSDAIRRAKGFWESIFPLAVVGFGLIGTTFLVLYTEPNFNPKLYIAGLIISLVGITIDVFAIWKIRRSFSIMTEARKLVTTGIYGYIRHPLYIGEIIHIGGLALLFNNNEAYMFFLITLVVQTQRAYLEEKKLESEYTEYKEYRKKTGFYFPFLSIKSLIT